MRIAIALLFAAGAAAQDPARPPEAAISGTVLDAATGRPLAKYSVSTYSGGNDFSTLSDEQGRYRLAGLPPGDYSIQAHNSQGSAGFAGMTTRHITVAGQDIEHIDFKIRVPATITGRVIDENREPVVGASVFLVSREYFSGVLGYFFKDVTSTDDRGRYSLKRIEAGHAYLVMADNPERGLDARSIAPLDPKLRRRGILRTFYPNSPDRQGGSVLIVPPGETREGVDIEVRKSPTYCVEGTLLSLAGPAALNFQLEGAQPAYGESSNSGMYGRGFRGQTGPDGKYRLCGLVPGSYRLSALAPGAGQRANRALVPFDITDRDIRNLDLTVSPGMTVAGEVVWDGPAEQPSEVKVNVGASPLLRSPVGDERAYARADLPGSFALEGLLPTDYAVFARINAPGMYIKDVTYAGRSVRYEPLRPGAVGGGLGLKVAVARDGGTVRAAVADKDGNPLPDIRVVVLPASITSEAMLQAAMVSGQTDQHGRYRSPPLAPGKYLVLATDDLLDATPECIDNLWRSRRQFQEIDLEPKGSAQVSLTPVRLRK